ncbi:MAG: hypothetical protein AAF288_01815 [Planctomycetota bacterium]
MIQSDTKRHLIYTAAAIAVLAVAAGLWAHFSADPDDVVFTPPTPAPADQLADPALAGSWKPLGMWVDGKPVAEVIVSGSSMKVEFMNPAQRSRQGQEFLLRAADTTPTGEDDLLGVTAELTGGRGVPSGDIGTQVHFAYRFEGDMLHLAWNMAEPTQRPDTLEDDGVMALQFRRYEDAPEAEPSNDPDAVHADPALEGRWLFVPENLRMVMLADRVLYLTVPDYLVAMEQEIVSWQPDAEPRKIESVLITSPRRSELGDRHRVIYTELRPGRIKMAAFHEASPMKSQWPAAFDMFMPMGLMTFEWERIDP